jgi:formylglycine-generating enzyme required for sulfatase activity
MCNLYLILASLVACLGLAAAGSAASAAPPHGKAFRDCASCPEMMPLPAGSFMMGTPVEEELRSGMPKPQTGRASPVHKVTFAKGFAMGVYPVTVAQFRAFVEESGYKAADSCVSQHMSDGHFIYEDTLGATWRNPGFPQGGNYPVVCVSGEDAEAYAAWLTRKTGHKYAVPNEAQYEYALRAGTTTAYFWGNERDARACEYSNQPDLDQAAAMAGAPSGPEYRFQCHDGYAWTSPVDHYKPNPWGLHDMQGNIWEWTSDCLNENYDGAPTDGSTWRTGDCDGRMSRGGSYGNAVFSTYAGVRAPRYVGYVGHSWGFRVVRTD